MRKNPQCDYDLIHQLLLFVMKMPLYLKGPKSQTEIKGDSHLLYFIKFGIFTEQRIE
jgi:hypothetical protein